jgi:Asp-tRNA(Asn)/Glu-tRNA(Gln) amidotransferase A subunit family amidase
VEAVDLSQGREAAQMNALMTTSDAAAFHRDRLRDHPHRFGADVLARMERGAQFTSTEYILARRFQSEWRRRLERLFEQFDLLLTPATPITAPVIEGLDAIEAARQLTRCTAPFNLAGLPGALGAVRSERRRIADRVADRCRALERSAGAARRQGIRERNAMASPDSAQDGEA